MNLLTQRNASLVFGAAFAWSTVITAYPTLIPDKINHAIGAGFLAMCSWLGYMGFSRTPAGNLLPPDVVTKVDRQVVVTQATNKVIEAAAAQVMAAAQDVKDRVEDGRVEPGGGTMSAQDAKPVDKT